jgi:hypothetical protein
MDTRLEKLALVKNLAICQARPYNPIPQFTHKLVHHSVSDWDFRYTTWLLDTTQYVSPLTSLRLWYTSAQYFSVLLKAAGCTVIDQGRLVGQIRRYNATTSRPGFFFRAQAPVGTSTPNNSYFVHFLPTTWSWSYIDAGGATTSLGTPLLATAVDTWYLRRISWWNGKDLMNNDATVLRLEQWDGAAWVQVGDDLYDTNQRNKGSAINRPGVGALTGTAATILAWHDDTELWIP